MDTQQIKTLMDVMASSDLSELEFSQDGWTLRLRRHPTQRANLTSHLPAMQQPAPSTSPPAPATQPASTTLCAPLYGVVHLSPSPAEPAFACLGEAVRAGQPLCVIEAMKVFNEVRAEHDGVLQDILVTAGQEVEGGQALFRFA